MAKPISPRAGDRYSAKEVLQILESGQYTFANGGDDSDNNSHESVNFHNRPVKTSEKAHQNIFHHLLSQRYYQRK